MATLSFSGLLPKTTRCACYNCGKTWAFSDLHDMSDIQDRIAPGETVPAGQCPECCGLTHLIEEIKS